jgi:uncharacterized phage-associated protein
MMNEITTTSALDVAAYILSKCQNINHMKLQKLLYYCQAWSMVWDKKPMFYERIEVRNIGPIVNEIYILLQHLFKVTINDISLKEQSFITYEQQETIDAVISFYSDKTAQWLNDLIRLEQPWIDAKRDMHDEINISSLAKYYSSL